jgi:1-aminocyclopropane-1-carboxylate deaminase/D-cysteine desulfhydrase-like pyridoxal-dependent ACC family enzyme
MPQSLIKDTVPEIHFNEPTFSKLNTDFFGINNLEIFMLRLDEIHPVISGNKLFKLIYFLQEAKKSRHKKIITFGGAYSNHLAATAFACKELKIKSVGIVRGEKPKVLSPTLLFCLENKMQLEFISRDSYKKTNEKGFLNPDSYREENKYGEHILIPEGGFSIKGKEGAGLIDQYFTDKNFTHVCLPVGTATTFAGLVDTNKNETEIIGFGVLKNFNDIEKRFAELKVNPRKKYSFIGDYHFGGYAKKTNELISFMNDFYEQNKIALDFVYTAKMMFGIYDLIQKKYFPDGSKILCIHTGGLQGNSSLQSKTV